MAILSYEYNQAVSDHHAALEKIKNFAVACGWTAQEWSKNSVAWGDTGGGVYGWISGAESYLRLYSTGYGSQNLQYRFKLPDTGTNNSRILSVGAFLTNNSNDTTNAAHPVGRNSLGASKWNTHGDFSLSSDPVDLWLFGNEKVIIAVVKYDGSYIQAFGFGSLELIDSAETEGAWASYNYDTNFGVTPWYNKDALCPFDVFDGAIYKDSARVFGGDLFPSFVMNSGSGYSNHGPGSMARMVCANEYSEIRPLAKQIVHVVDSGDGFLYALGTHWASRIWHRGLQIGEHIFYGDSEYVVFPYGQLRLDAHNYGFAIQVA